MHEIIKKETALLVVVIEQREPWSSEALAAEFKSLVVSTGIEVVDLVFVRLSKINPSFYIGRGKVEELAAALEGVDVIIFNNNLNFTQQRNLEDILGRKTIDRTQLILDLFAKHAQTREGILQVELAQLNYLMPRLRGKGIMLSRLGGGIGTRGPGEKKLEVDRRRISNHIIYLKKDLRLIKQHRDVMRKKREKERINICSLVGYTNAGKTTLFNALTQSSQTTSSALFTTLDAVTHVFPLRSNSKTVLSDTVGFIYNLPPNLIEAFKATLEELHYANVLLHVIDAASRNISQVKKTVDSLLKELGLESKFKITVFNKIDELSEQEVGNLKSKYPQAVFISAARNIGLEVLKEEIYKNIFQDAIEVVVRLPFDRMDIVNYLHEHCEVLKVSYQKEAVYWVKMSKHELSYIEKQGLKIKEIA